MPLVVKFDATRLSLRTSGAAKSLAVSTWRVYDAAPTTSLQSNVNGCGTDSPTAGDSSAGAAGVGGVDGGVDVDASVASLTTNASPQKIDVLPLNTVSSAPVVVGKSSELVWPMM